MIRSDIVCLSCRKVAKISTPTTWSTISTRHGLDFSQESQNSVRQWYVLHMYFFRCRMYSLQRGCPRKVSSLLLNSGDIRLSAVCWQLQHLRQLLVLWVLIVQFDATVSRTGATNQMTQKQPKKRQRLYKQAVKEMCIQVVVVLVLDFDARESEVVENKVQWCANQSTVVVEGNWTKRKLMSHHHDSPYLQNQIPRHNALVILNLFPDFKFRIWTSTFWSNTRNCLRLDSERNLRHSVCRSVPTCQSQGNKKYCTSISIILISVWYGRKRIWLDWWPSGNPEWCTFPSQQILKFSTDAFDSTRMKVWTVLIG